jgi:hypothetical protein
MLVYVSPGVSRFPDRYLHDVLRMVRLSDQTRDFPRARPGVLVREPGAENRPPGSMSGVWRRDMVEMVGHPRTKGRANRGKQTST